MHVGHSLNSRSIHCNLTPSLQLATSTGYNPATDTVVVYNLGNMAWVIAATALVWIMIPGVGFFYSGLLRRKNALSNDMA